MDVISLHQAGFDNAVASLGTALTPDQARLIRRYTDNVVVGYDSDAANRLILWSAKLPQSFDMAAFSRGDYVRALERNAMAETISKVLYPADDHIQGKRLRLKQQYLLVSASLQSILKKHYRKYHTYANLADKLAIHINDTDRKSVV